jgi:hypothetical protein
MEPGRSAVAAARALLCSLAGAGLLAACSTRSVAPLPRPTQAKIDLPGLDPGTILITSSVEAAVISLDPPNRRVEPMSEGAADATRSFLNTPNLGNPQLEAGVGVIQFALAPFAAAYGAMSARRQQLTPEEMSEAQLQLADAMRSNAVPELLVQKVGEIARQKTRRLLTCSGSSSNAPPTAVPVSAVLEIAVKNLQLKAAKPGASQYRLSLEASARFVRSSDGKVLLERSYHYESGPGLFFDWTRNGGLEGVVETGYRVLAEQIAEDVFEPAAAPPILIGPEPKSARAPCVRISKFDSRLIRCSQWSSGGNQGVRWEARDKILGRPAVHLAYRYEMWNGVGNWRRRLRAQVGAGHLMDNNSLQFASVLQEETGSMEVHTGKTDERLRAPKPGPETGSDSGLMSDTKWTMDGLEEDRNAVVQGVSCLAAVPMGLWEQTGGLIRKRSQERMDKFANTLRTATTQAHFEGDLADEVARCLQSRVVDPVRRTDEPLRLSFTSEGEASGRQPTEIRTSAPCKTALEIQVLNTKLLGKHRNSRSRAVYVEIQATVFRTSDGQELYSRPIRYQSSEKALKDWAASDAKLFRQELDACSRRTAQALASDLIAHGFATPLQGTNSAVLNRPE